MFHVEQGSPDRARRAGSGWPTTTLAASCAATGRAQSL